MLRGDQEALHCPAARDTAAEKARGVYPSVVDDQQISARQAPRKVPNRQMFHTFRCAIQYEQARGASSRGFLRDEMRWELVVEIRNAHRP